MADDRIATTTVAANVAETDPIVLRETDQVRLVFKPMLVPKDEAPVRGYFVWQRKLKASQWEDITGEALTNLKAGEGYSLELKSGEVAALIEGLEARKELYERYGINPGKHDYLAGAGLPEIVKKIIEEPDSELAKVLRELDPDSLLSLGRTVDLSKLDQLLAEWDANESNNDEEFWQDLLKRNAWVFSQLTGSPVVLLQEKAYVGGKGISNTGGGQVDYLLANELTENVSLVEIKTPGADLCADEYRNRAYPPGEDVVGGVMQVLTYRDTFLSEIRTLRESTESYQAYDPRCYLIVGRVASLTHNGDALRSFELFRAARADVQILTFDEVRARLKGIREALTVTEAAEVEAPAEEPGGPPATDVF
jgi:hypothetical protein